METEKNTIKGTVRPDQAILLLEDDGLVRGFCREVLESEGYVVFEADSPVRAQQILEANESSVALLLTDYQIPDLGNCRIPIPDSGLATLRLDTRNENHVPAKVFWLQDHGYAVPEQYVLKLKPGVHAGGIVRDKQGNPIAGANVGLQYLDVEADFVDKGWGSIAGTFAITATTDATGAWSTTSAPTNLLSVTISEPDYESVTIPLYSLEPRAKARKNLEDVLSGILEVALEAETRPRLEGIVLDQEQNPIADAQVYEESHSVWQPATTSNDNGCFVLRCGPRQREPKVNWNLMVVAEGFAAERITQEAARAPSPMRVYLHPIVPVEVQVVDENGQGIQEAGVTSEGHGFRVDLPGKSDENGTLIWRTQPKETVTLNARARGFEVIGNVQAAGTNPGPYAIAMRRLPSPINISGTAVDRITRQPLERFEVTLLEPSGAPIDTYAFRDGLFSIRLDPSDRMPDRLRATAPAYERALGSLSTNLSGHLVSNFELSQSRSGIRGVVLQPNGQPAASAELALFTRSRVIELKQRHISHCVLTDASGSFVLSDELRPLAVVAVHETGFACLPVHDIETEVLITLQGWGRIEGRAGEETEPGTQVELQADSRWAIIFRDVAPVRSDTERTFAFETVPPGECALFVRAGEKDWLRRTEVQVRPGQASVTQLSTDSGRRIVGRFILPSVHPTGTHWFAHLRHWPPSESELQGNDPPPGIRFGLQNRKKWVILDYSVISSTIF